MRLSTLSIEELTPAQRNAWDVIAGTRGRVIGPYQVLLQRPDLAIAVANLGTELRFKGTLPGADRELAILSVGSEWGARFEWSTHEPIARKEGVDPAAIAALQNGTPIDALAPRAQLVVRIARALCRDHTVDDALYARALAEFGEPMLVELITLVGFYCLISCVLDGFAVEPG